jgi:cbb3-type cytochrome oxidase subunit 1
MQSTLDPAMKIPVVYNDAVVRRFAIMTVIWGIVGMLVGVVIAAELFWPAFLWLGHSTRGVRYRHVKRQFGRLSAARGLHTAAGWLLPVFGALTIYGPLIPAHH